MRKGWSIANQEEAIEEAESVMLDVIGGEYRKTRFSDADMRDLLSFFADGERFVSASKEELTDLFDEINFRFCTAHNIKPANVTLLEYGKGTYLYGASDASGDIKMYCLFDKSQVDVKKFDHIGTLYLAYMYHELRHHYQFCMGEKFINDYMSNNESTKTNVIIDACNKINFIEQCYSYMNAKIDDFYEFNTAERDANYCAFNIITNLIKEYPEYEEQLSAGLIDICNIYLQIENSNKVDVIENEIKFNKYYYKNFLKDFSSGETLGYNEWIKEFDEEKFRNVREKQRNKVVKFIENYTQKEYNKALQNPNLKQFHSRIKKIKEQYSTFELNVGLRLMKLYDYDIDKAENDLVNHYYVGVESLLKDEKYTPAKTNVNIEETKILY